MLLFLTLVYVALVIVRPHEYPQFADSNFSILPVSLVLATVAWLLSQNKSFKAPQYLLIVLLLLAIVLSDLATGFVGGALAQFTSFAPTVIIFVLMANAAVSRGQVRATMAVFVLCSAVLAYYGLQQSQLGVGWTGMPLSQGTRIQYIGIFSDPNDLGMLFVMTAPMAFLLSSGGGWLGLKRLFWLALLGLLLYGIYLTDSRGAMLAAAAVIGVYVWRYRGLTFALIAAGGGFGLLKLLPSRLDDLDAGEESAAGRIDAWYEGLQLAFHEPLFGVGAGNFTEYNSLTAHNSLVLIFAETGFFGYLIWFAFVGYTFRMMLAVIQHEPPDLDASTKTAWRAEVTLAAALLASLVGTYTAAFFLSRAYMVLLYMQAALVVGFYTGVRQRFPSLPEFRLERDLVRWPFLALGSVIALYVVVKLLLD